MKRHKTGWILLLVLAASHTAGLAQTDWVSVEERNRREREFLYSYKAATNQEDFLLQHLQTADELEIGNLVWMIKNKSQNLIGDGKPIPPQFPEALEKWHSHSNSVIADQAKKALQDMARYQFDEFKSEFRKGFVTQVDKKAFLYKYAAAKNNLIKNYAAEKLAEYNDPQAISVLQKMVADHKLPPLEKENRNELPTAETGKGLEKSDIQPVLKKLVSDDFSPVEKARLIRKYALSDKETDRENIYVFLKKEAAVDPQLFVPLLTEYFGHDVRSEKAIASAYPALINKGLDRCLQGWSGTRITGCIELITRLKKAEYIQGVFDVTFGEQGYLNYKNTEETESARKQALLLFSAVGPVSLPQLMQIIYSDEKYDGNKQEALKTIAGFKTKDSLAVLHRFLNSTSLYLDKKINSTRTIREELTEIISDESTVFN